MHDPEQVDHKKFIIVKGARVHNLKNVSVAIPRNKLTVVTGLSGSGKSSLAFDTLYAEGQRRYVESLSSYARQFLGRHEKPDVDAIIGISPAVAIEQKVISKNSRSTVGTSTEIYDYLKLLYARIGKTFSPVSGQEVKKHVVRDVTHYIQTTAEESERGYILVALDKAHLESQLALYEQQGFVRIKLGEKVVRIADVKPGEAEKEECWLVIDRFQFKANDEEGATRLADSIQLAFDIGQGECTVELLGQKKLEKFSNRFELDGIKFEEPTLHFFSFNNPVGACKTCEGFGQVLGIDPKLVIPDTRLSVYEDAVVCWKGEKMSAWKDKLIYAADALDFPIHKPIRDLDQRQLDLLWNGGKGFKGIHAFFKHVESKSYKIQYRVLLSRYRGKTTCPDCNGTRLRKDAGYVKVGGTSIQELVVASVDQCSAFFNDLKISTYDEQVAHRILVEIKSRLSLLQEVGLGYLTLNRLSASLSGGESQRINLATSIGSSLVGSLYVLDEPSIGLHSRDTDRLIQVLLKLKQQGNTVLVVEHDEDIMRHADEILDIGPASGSHGGHVVFQGSPDELLKDETSLTRKYLQQELKVQQPEQRRKWKDRLELKGATQHNLKGVDVTFPLRAMTVVTGVSGSGKSTLVKGVLVPAIKSGMGQAVSMSGSYDALTGDLSTLDQLEFVDQNPIGKSSRSNPVTYVKAYDEIRNLFAAQQMSKVRGYKPAHFSFNTTGGRCEECQGEGEVVIEMQFMADVKLTCEVCKGKRFKDEVLEVQVEGNSIYDVLEMTVDDAVAFFESRTEDRISQKVANKIRPLQEVGLGYIKLGQASSTLSGGEAQRVKLATFLSKEKEKTHTLFVFDEPSTGLHFQDVDVLITAFNKLLDRGNSIVIVEHHLDIIKNADWVIDMGPEGGEAGGNLVFSGTPEELIKCKESHTGRYLKTHLKG